MHVFALKDYIIIVDKDFMQLCDACNFDSDKEQIKIHNIKEQRFTLFHNCEKNT